MKFRIGFTANTNCHLTPIVDICVDGKNIQRVVLNQCSRTEDLSAEIQYVDINAAIDDRVTGSHLLSIHATNITDEHKQNGDFGFQIRYIEINQVVLDWFSKSTTTYNPVDDGYVNNFIKPNNKLHEIQTINNQLVHVVHGQYANYVNMPNGWFELTFDTPLYNWILNNFFGNLANILVKA